MPDSAKILVVDDTPANLEVITDNPVLCRLSRWQTWHLLCPLRRVLLEDCFASIDEYYRNRFGIETSYRLKNHGRIRTTTKNPILRFLFVALAFVLVNLWVYLLWYFVSCLLTHAVERRFPLITAIYLPVSS